MSKSTIKGSRSLTRITLNSPSSQVKNHIHDFLHGVLEPIDFDQAPEHITNCIALEQLTISAAEGASFHAHDVVQLGRALGQSQRTPTERAVLRLAGVTLDYAESQIKLDTVFQPDIVEITDAGSCCADEEFNDAEWALEWV